MHLDPREDVVPARFVTEGVAGNVAIELAVDARKEVEIELGRDAFRVVVGGDQSFDRFYAIHPDQELRSRAEQGAELAEQVGRAPRDEVADGRTGEEAEFRQLIDAAGQGERPREVGHHGHHLDRWEALLQVPGALLEIVARDVHRDVGGRRDRLQQDRRLGCRARSEFHDNGTLGDSSGDLGHDRREKSQFRCASDSKTGAA